MTQKHSVETIRKISLAQIGKKNSFYGHKHDRMTLQALSEANEGKKNPMFGRRHSAAAREKIRQAALKRYRGKK